MVTPRKEIVPDNESGIYHCTSRCVRRAFLCGIDRLTGNNFNHRRDWVKARLQTLAQIFSVKIYGYAAMSNHLHVILETQVEEANTWSPQDIARRWLTLFPKHRNERGDACEPAPAEIRQLAADKNRVHELRSRLCSLSWFMRCLNELIARMANREDNCKGRFWEGRFHSQRLLDEGALFACMAYVDLNPIRSKAATTLQNSQHTSIHDRITAYKAEAAVKHLKNKDNPGTLTKARKEQLQHKQKQSRAADWLAKLESCAISCTTSEYLQILDWTGRQLKAGKRGRIADNVKPILTRLQLDHNNWLKTVDGYGRTFWRVAGRTEAIEEAAAKVGRKWFRGILAAKSVFVTPASG